MENEKNPNTEAGKSSPYIIKGAGKVGKIGTVNLQESIIKQLTTTSNRERKISFDIELGKEQAARFKAGIDNLVKAMGKASGHVLEAAKSIRRLTKHTKLNRAAAMRYTRENRTMILRDKVQEALFQRDDEMYCWNCDLEGTFCEGARCEYQAKTYWEQERGRTEWKSIIYDALGDEYYNLSLRKKLELLKDLY